MTIVLASDHEPPAPSCDEWAGLVEVQGDPTAGCVQRVELDIGAEWYSVALAGVVLVLVALYALVIGQLRRS